MKYESGSAFRRALEERLRNRNIQSGIPLVWLRKLVVFDRFLARLFTLYPDKWVVKGGLALQLRLGGKARTTKDIDVLALAYRSDIYPALRDAGTLDLEDWFLFEVEKPARGSADDFGGLRFQVRAILDGRAFETFHIDVGEGDPVLEAPENLPTPDLLKFADIQPTIVPCYPLTQQIAEKLHAYTRSHPSGESSRVKDFTDMLLIAQMGTINGAKLSEALLATFNGRRTHPMPTQLPDPPKDWQRSFGKMAGDVGLGYVALDDAVDALRQFLNPVLAGEVDKEWNPFNWEWK
jgi:hypothetical protein